MPLAQTLPVAGGLKLTSQYNSIYSSSEACEEEVRKAGPISEEEVARIQEIFRPFDDTGKGKAPIDDLPTIIRLLGYNLTEAQFEEIKIAVSEKHGGKLPVFTFDELLDLLQES